MITLSNPDARNALHPDTLWASNRSTLPSATAACTRSVLTGADNFFCTGGNLNRLMENRAKEPSVQAQSIDLLAEWISALRASTKPIIAAVEGAGGCGLFAGARVRSDRSRRRCEIRHVVCARRPDPGRRRIVVRVARMLALCEDESVVGRAFYVMAFVEGRVLWDPSLPGMTPAERVAIYDETNPVIAALHCVDVDAAGLSSCKPGNYFERQIGRWSKQYVASETEPIDSMNQLIDWLPRHIPPSRQTKVSVVHGDYQLVSSFFRPSRACSSCSTGNSRRSAIRSRISRITAWRSMSSRRSFAGSRDSTGPRSASPMKPPTSRAIASAQAS